MKYPSRNTCTQGSRSNPTKPAYGPWRRGRQMLAAALFASAFAMTPSLFAKEAINPILAKNLEQVPGKEMLMYTVEFPPGHASPIHRHDAQVAVYVLDGSVVMQVKGGKETTLKPGQSFYEARNDVHVVSRNASRTKSAKFVVFMIKDKHAPLLKLEK